MTALEAGTWAAIGVLVFGSSAIFVWFLVDVVHEVRRRRKTGDESFDG